MWTSNVVHEMKKLEYNPLKLLQKVIVFYKCNICVEKFKYVSVLINVLLWKVYFVETTVSLHYSSTSNSNRNVFLSNLLSFSNLVTLERSHYSVYFLSMNNLTPDLILNN